MSLRGYLYSHYWRVACAWQKRSILKQSGPKLACADWERSLSDPTGFYLDCFRYFHQRLPAELREHRSYFCQERRGFNEDAMHVMWHLLFQEFGRLSRDREGMGLGLAISCRLAHALGGDLTAESDSGQGSTFTLWLPLSRGERADVHRVA